MIRAFGENKFKNLKKIYCQGTTAAAEVTYSAKSSAGSTKVLPRYYRGTTAAAEAKSSYFRGRGSTMVVTRKIGYFRRRGSAMAVKKFFFNFEKFLAPKALIICLKKKFKFFFYFRGTTMAVEVSRKIGLLPLPWYYRGCGRSVILLPPPW